MMRNSKMGDRQPTDGAPENPPTQDLTLARLAVGEIGPEDAMDLIFQIMAEKDDLVADRMYEALRSLCWKLLTGRVFGSQMRAWRNVYRQAEALLRSKGFETSAARVRVLAELVVESARFGDFHSGAAMAVRPHVRAILDALAARGAYAMRDDIREDTKLGQANLSRILANMASIGLVDRQQIGREVALSLTAFGKEILACPKVEVDDEDVVRFSPTLGVIG